MADEKKIGDINVEMGDGNTVGDIGHKITFHAPPPDPNSIWQDGSVVGVMGSVPSTGNGTYTFPKLFVEESFDRNSEFTIQGVHLKFESSEADTVVSMGGRPPLITIWNAVCRVIK